MHTTIGKIVKSNSHIDYVCQVYGEGEMSPAPDVAAYAFASFVGIDGEDPQRDPRIVGVVYNTLLMNPDFGSLGPRLSSQAELEVFSPDYLAETATLLGVLAVGWIDGAGAVRQGVPTPAASINASVRRLDAEEVRHFHVDEGGRLMLRYAPLLMRQSDPLAAPLLLAIVDQLNDLFPQEEARLNVMRNSVAWRSIVQPAG
jgi:hypothetical protein